MTLWIVTIGSSDVQLDSDRQNRNKGRTEKQRSDKVWQYWYEDAIKAECYDLPFEPKPAYPDLDEAYRIAPRVLGKVYQSSSESVQTEIWSYLTFPLLDHFVAAMKDVPAPDAIAVLLTNQANIFEPQQQQKLKCPYWQDTCKLQPILQRYFQEKFPGVVPNWLELIPADKTKGLDNWNSVLDLVRCQIQSCSIATQSHQLVYVSHQAGTPAISSAVQFVSLAQFDQRVKFLVSSEYDEKQTDFVKSSSYLEGLRLEKAKKLLNRHDYAGVQELLSGSLDEQTNILLNAAIQWNAAEFEQFAKTLQKSSEPKLRVDADFVLQPQDSADSERRTPRKKQNETQTQRQAQAKNWWWMAYEAAWLGVVRLRQGNTTEAMFHSFRAVEGLLYQWVVRNYKVQSVGRQKVIATRAGEPIEKSSDQSGKETSDQKEDSKSYYTAYGKELYNFWRDQEKRETSDSQVFGKYVFDQRNQIFHQLEGIKDKTAVFAKWQDPNETKWKDGDEEKWQARILNCLNVISEQTVFESDRTLEEISLMAKVHAKLRESIDPTQKPNA